MLKSFNGIVQNHSSVFGHQGYRSLLSLLVVCLFAFCSFLSVVSFANPPKPKGLQQLNGILAALEDGYSNVKGKAFKHLSEYEPAVLQSTLKQPEKIAQKAAAIFRDKTQLEENRNRAVEALGVLGDAAKPYLQDIEDYLREGIKDTNSAGYGAAIALGHLGEIAQSNISRLLKDRTFRTTSGIRVLTWTLLESLGSTAQRYIPEILNILKDETLGFWPVRTSAAEALEKLGTAAQSSLPELINILEREKKRSDVSPDTPIQHAIFLAWLRLAIANIGGAPYLSDIINLLQEERNPAANFSQWERDKTFWRKALAFLVNQGKAVEPYISELVNLLKDDSKDPYFRCSAALALAKLGKTAQAKPYISNIVNLLKDKSQEIEVRTAAATTVTQLGEAAQPYIPDLINFLEEETLKGHSYGLVESFGNLGDVARPYVPNLIKLFKDGDSVPYNKDKGSVSFAAARTLDNLGMSIQPYASEIATILRDQKRYISNRISAAAMLGNLGEAAQVYVPDIAALLQDDKLSSSSDRVDRVVEALGKIQKLNLGQAIAAINYLYYPNLDYVQNPKVIISNTDPYQFRFNIYLSSSGDEEVQSLLKWLGKPHPDSIPKQLTHEQGRKTLALFAEAWELSENLPLPGEDLLKQRENNRKQEEEGLKLREEGLKQLEKSFKPLENVYSEILKHSQFLTQEKLQIAQKRTDLKQQGLQIAQERENLKQQGLRVDLARQIIEVVKNKQVQWKLIDLPLLQGQANSLKAAGFKTAALENVIQDLKFRQWRFDIPSFLLGLVALCTAFVLGMRLRMRNRLSG